MKELKVGDKVTMSAKGKATFDDSGLNPFNLKGIVSEVFEGHISLPIQVRWDNGESNCYALNHLQPVTVIPYIEVEEGKIKLNPKGADRYDDGKPELSLINPEFEEELARVLMFGCQKYERENWRKGQNFLKVISCVKRHTSKFLKGEDLDKESGCHHMAHVAANAMFLVYYYLKDMDNFDDRYKGEQDV